MESQGRSSGVHGEGEIQVQTPCLAHFVLHFTVCLLSAQKFRWASGGCPGSSSGWERLGKQTPGLTHTLAEQHN